MMICPPCANELADIGAEQVAALRQQRDVLTEVLEAIARGSHCGQTECCINSPLCGPMIARAALVSIEEAGD